MSAKKNPKTKPAKVPRGTKVKAKTAEQVAAERQAAEQAAIAAKQVIVEAVCARVAAGEPVRVILKTEGMPAECTWYSWLIKDEAIAEQYARACEARTERHAEELLEIADDGTNDWMERFNDKGESIGWTINGEHVQRSKLRYEARRWLMGKMKPKKYGDKVTAEVSGPDGAPIKTEATVSVSLDPFEAYRLMKQGGRMEKAEG
jgi:hypothetical protein